MNLEEFKTKARQKFWVEKTNIAFNNPIHFLYSLDWVIPNGTPFNQEVMSTMNIDLDERGCFGRAVKATVLTEIFFPNEKIYFGEVCRDLLASMLIQGAVSDNWLDQTYIAEILQYEDPHAVIVWNNNEQFDPIFKFIDNHNPQKLKHLSVISYDIWEGLYCSYVVSEAILAMEKRNDVMFAKELLENTLITYPDNILIRLNLSGVYVRTNQVDKAIYFAKEIVHIKKDAKTLFFLYVLTGEEDYKNRIITEYNSEMFNYLNSIYQ